MSKTRRSRVKRKKIRMIRSGIALLVLLVVCVVLAAVYDRLTTKPIENAEEQMTNYTEEAAQVYIDGQWYAERDMETVLVMGIDDFGAIVENDSYNNDNQADFLVLLMQDRETNESYALHLNRDTMTDVPVLGVLGKPAGSQYAQVASAFNYGSGQEDSCENTVSAVQNLLYGVEIDHYIAVTMDSVPILNDWAGGVTLEIMDDFAGIDDTLVKGSEVKLQGQHALTYVRQRGGLTDSSNLRRMERQRQYAAAWFAKAEPRLTDSEAMAELALDMSDYHYSDCTINELTDIAERFTRYPPDELIEIEGESVRGEEYMEYYVNEGKLQEQILELFYVPVNA